MKISFNKDGLTGSILYSSEDWLAGMDTSSAGSNYGKMGGNPFMSEIDPLRAFGYVSPSYNGVAATNNGSITRILRNAVVNGADAFIVSGGALNSGSGSGDANIQKFTIATATISTSSFPHTIAHSGHSNVSGDDINHYYTTSGSLAAIKAFYSFEDATDWDIGTLTYPSTFNDSYMSTTAVGSASFVTTQIAGQGYPHPLITGDNDIMYIGDRNFVHSYDRSTNTFSLAELTLPLGWIITCFTRTQDLRLAIGAYFTTTAASSGVYNRGQAKVFLWTYDNLDFDYAIDLKDNYVSEIIPWTNTIAAFTYGRKTLSDKGPNKLQVLNGTQFEVVKTWGSSGSALELPVRGGVDNVGNDLYWSAAGQVFAYTKRPDNGQYILNQLVTVGSASGLLKFFSASSIYSASFGVTTDGLQSFTSNYNDAGNLNCQVATPDWPILMKGNLSRISIKFKDTFSGGRTLRLLSRIDDGNTILIDDFQSSSVLRLIQIQSRTNGSPLGTFSSLQPQLIWADNGTGSDRETACPVVEYVKYDF